MAGTAAVGLACNDERGQSEPQRCALARSGRNVGDQVLHVAERLSVDKPDVRMIGGERACWFGFSPNIDGRPRASGAAVALPRKAGEGVPSRRTSEIWPVRLWDRVHVIVEELVVVLRADLLVQRALFDAPVALEG